MVLDANAANFENVFESWTEIARGKSSSPRQSLSLVHRLIQMSVLQRTHAHTPDAIQRGAAF